MDDFINQVEDQDNLDSQRLFVYGSLMEGFFNYEKALVGKVISRTTGRVKGLLFHQSKKNYPAMVHGNGWIIGEFLELVDFKNLISICDSIEAYFGPGDPNNEYERLLIEVELINGTRNLAQAYFYARKDLGSFENPVDPVLSGNWREYMQTKDRTSYGLIRKEIV